MLQVTEVSRNYGAFKAVDGVSFKIDTGEIVGLLGHNGAGKTTIMKMLTGYLEPDRGRIEVDGLEVAHDPKGVQKGLGYLPESLPVYPDMSVAEYLDYIADLKGIEPELKTEEIRRVIHETDIKEKFFQPISTLSRGFKQRVGVAQAILGRPKFLILDEPTNGLDPSQTEQMRQLIRNLSRQATVILSTHIMQEVEAVCDRVLILKKGCLVVDARLEELKDSKQLLFSTSLPEEDTSRLTQLEGVQSIETLEPASGRLRYRVRLEEAAETHQVGAQLARAILEAGGELYQLQPEQRDLETLFRKANRKEGATDAAA